MKKMRKITAWVLTLCLAVSLLGIAAFAEGETAEAAAETVTGDPAPATSDGVYTISASGVYTVSGTGAQPIVVTAQDVTLNLTGAILTAPAGKSAIALESGASVTLNVSGVCSLTGGDDNTQGGCGIQVPSGASLTVRGATGADSLTAIGTGTHACGIGNYQKGAPSSGKIVIENLAALSAVGGKADCDLTSDHGKTEGGPAIGGGRTAPAGDSGDGTVTLTNCASVSAIGGSKSAAIGAGFWNACDVVISNCASVSATGGVTAAAIGVSRNPASEYGPSSVTITDSAVTAQGGYEGAGIGSGYCDKSYGDYARTLSDGTAGSAVSLPAMNLSIDGASVVTATGGKLGAGIGGGYKAGNVHIRIGSGASVTAYAGEKGEGGSKIPCGIGSGADGSGLFSDKNGSIAIADGASVAAFSYGYDSAAYNGTLNSQVLGSKWAIGRELDSSATTAAVLQYRFLTSDFYGEKLENMTELNPGQSNAVTLTSDAGEKSVTIPQGYTCMAVTAAPGTYTVSLNGQSWSYLNTLGYEAAGDIGGTAYTFGTFPESAYASYHSTYLAYHDGATVRYALDRPSADFTASAGVNSYDAVAYRPAVVPAPKPAPIPTPTPIPTPEPPAVIENPTVPTTEPPAAEIPAVTVPETETPAVTVPETTVPQAEIPETGVPKAEAPKTGDPSALLAVLAGVSGAGLAVLALTSRKRREQN